MAEPEQKKPPAQICSIRIMFPADTDDIAIEYKKKISDVLADIPQARIEFSLSSLPTRAGLNA